MNAGRELDAIIFEKIFHQTVCRNKRGVWSVGPADYYDSYGEMILSNPLPSYSEDIAAAWEVVETFQQVARLERRYHNGKCIGWWCELSRDIGSYESLAPTAPHAICLAALKSVGAL